jgi:hypothetical protein
LPTTNKATPKEPTMTDVHPSSLLDDLDLSADRVAEAIGIPIPQWAHQCHMVSLAIVKARLFPIDTRVARGGCQGVPSQHSWVVLGDDCDAMVLDPTLWSYVPGTPILWVGFTDERPHVPHGSGSLWDYGKPQTTGGEPIELTPKRPLSRDALDLLEMIGPLDRRGWGMLANAPVGGGWPAAELFAAMDDTREVRAAIPIDVLGMITTRNPSGLYLADDHGTSPKARPAYVCLECGHIEVGDHIDHADYDLACSRCVDAGRDDPYIIERIMVTKCPLETGCPSYDHHHGRQEHHVGVDG